jgi:hypothetical protein
LTTEGAIAVDPTKPNDETRAFEAEDAQTAHVPDDAPTDEEAAAAERAGDVDPEVAAHYEEMAERGANQKGEGRIP